MFFFNKLYKLARIFREHRVGRSATSLIHTLGLLTILVFSASSISADSQGNGNYFEDMSFHEQEVERVFSEDKEESFSVEMASWEEEPLQVETIQVAEKEGSSSSNISNLALIQFQNSEHLSSEYNRVEAASSGLPIQIKGSKFSHNQISKSGRIQNHDSQFQSHLSPFEEEPLQGRAMFAGKPIHVLGIGILEINSKVQEGQFVSIVSDESDSCRVPLNENGDIQQVIGSWERDEGLAVTWGEGIRIESSEENRIVRMRDVKKLSLWLPNQKELHSINFSTPCESLQLKSMIMRSVNDWKFLCLQARTIYLLAQSRHSLINL